MRKQTYEKHQKSKRSLRRIASGLLAGVLAVSLVTGCGGADDSGGTAPSVKETEAAETKETTPVGDESWAVYWYLCGSDLESGGGFATTDLQELMEVELPENVQVVIETGGASQWQNEIVDAEKLQRWVYDSSGFSLVEELPSASMGEADTLADFLSFARESYPADKTAVLFWNHGGGSVSGAAFDEIYGLDSLTVDEMYEAFTRVWDPSFGEPPIELVGFDTCLMATVDVAYTFSDLAHYLVASEETEPANGWLYSEWVGALAEDPSMDGEQLGKMICDAYYKGCEAVETQDDVTLSLTDLSKIGELLDAYEAFGEEALLSACEDPAFFSRFGRTAAKSENYGGNTREQGYTNMVDLGHLARQNADTMESAAAVLDALESCVLYRVNGQYRTEATGLSCYYSYNGDLDDYNSYAWLGAGTAFKYFYEYQLTGELSAGGMDYLAERSVTELPKVENLLTAGWEGAPLDVNEEGSSFMTLGPDADRILAGIGISLYYVDAENDRMMFLGTDNDMTADWENGVFYDNFRGVWGSLDGHLVYMELSFEGEDYNIYSVPILLNGEEYNLQVVYDFTEEKWNILGARQGIDDSGMADKELRFLETGDTVSTIWYLTSYSGEDEFEAYEAESFTVTPDTAFYESELPDGEFAMFFDMWDAMDNTASSAPVFFTCENGAITTTVCE